MFDRVTPHLRSAAPLSTFHFFSPPLQPSVCPLFRPAIKSPNSLCALYDRAGWPMTVHWYRILAAHSGMFFLLLFSFLFCFCVDFRFSFALKLERCSSNSAPPGPHSTSVPAASYVHDNHISGRNAHIGALQMIKCCLPSLRVDTRSTQEKEVRTAHTCTM